MTLKIGQPVRIAGPKYSIGIICGMVGDQYLVKIEPRQVRLRESQFEVLDELPQTSGELEADTIVRYQAFGRAGILFNEWDGNPATDPIPEEIQNLLRQAGVLKE
jgi:hypothetical protein